MKADAERRGVRASQRLRTTGRIQAVREAGTACECGPFRVQWRFRPLAPADAGHPRFAVIASRRVGGAVVRNRCKRRLRELFRQHQTVLPEGCDVVLIARHRMAAQSWPELARAYDRALERIKETHGRSAEGRER